MKKLDITGFSDQIDEKTKLSVKWQVIISLILGSCYVCGGIFWINVSKDFSEVIQIWTFLCLMVLYPLLYWLLRKLLESIIKWPVCPECGKGIKNKLPTVCTRFCPHCGEEILKEDRRPVVIQPWEFLVLPRGESEKTYTAIFRQAGILPVVGIIALYFILLIEDFKNPPEMPVLVGITASAVGIFVILYQLFLYLFEWLGIRMFRCFYNRNQERKLVCPECGEPFWDNHYHATGNCGNCGMMLWQDWIPEETSPILELPHWKDLKKYVHFQDKSESIFLIFFPLIFTTMLVVIMAGSRLVVIILFAFLFVTVITLFALSRCVLADWRRKYHILRQCPYCGLKYFKHHVLTYHRCRGCARLLVKKHDRL